jgi:acyl-CoA thioester hydrolase
VSAAYHVRPYDLVLSREALEALGGALDFPRPFAVGLKIQAEEIDAFGHANNTAYPRWMEACAWAHSTAVGLDPARCQALGRGMALKGLKIDYLRAGLLHQPVVIANWIVRVDRLRAERQFQVLDGETHKTLARGFAHYVCIDLATGGPTRMPRAFSEGYVVSAGVADGASGLARD